MKIIKIKRIMKLKEFIPLHEHEICVLPELLIDTDAYQWGAHAA
jgi:hypothetical protein